MTAQPRLPAELTIYTVAALRPHWLEWLGDSADTVLQLDAGAPAEIDAAGVQLLLSLANALRSRQRRLRLVNPSVALRRACDALGVSALLADPELEGAAA